MCPCLHDCDKNPPKKHAKLIIAWANGAKIQVRISNGDWVDCFFNPTWDEYYEFRIKPEPQPNIIMYACLNMLGIFYTQNMYNKSKGHNIKCTYDGTTHALKYIEVIKG